MKKLRTMGKKKAKQKKGQRNLFKLNHLCHGIYVSRVYQRPPFDTDKIYQLISDVVDKTFVTDDEDEPYVYDANENVNLCQRISKDIRDTLKTWRQLMRLEN